MLSWYITTTQKEHSDVLKAVKVFSKQLVPTEHFLYRRLEYKTQFLKNVHIIINVLGSGICYMNIYSTKNQNKTTITTNTMEQVLSPLGNVVACVSSSTFLSRVLPLKQHSFLYPQQEEMCLNQKEKVIELGRYGRRGTGSLAQDITYGKVLTFTVLFLLPSCKYLFEMHLCTCISVDCYVFFFLAAQYLF